MPRIRACSKAGDSSSTAGGGSFFMPMLMGYMLGNAFKQNPYKQGKNIDVDPMAKEMRTTLPPRHYSITRKPSDPETRTRPARPPALSENAPGAIRNAPSYHRSADRPGIRFCRIDRGHRRTA